MLYPHRLIYTSEVCVLSWVQSHLVDQGAGRRGRTMQRLSQSQMGLLAGRVGFTATWPLPHSPAYLTSNEFIIGLNFTDSFVLLGTKEPNGHSISTRSGGRQAGGVPPALGGTIVAVAAWLFPPHFTFHGRNLVGRELKAAGSSPARPTESGCLGPRPVLNGDGSL